MVAHRPLEPLTQVRILAGQLALAAAAAALAAAAACAGAPAAAPSPDSPGSGDADAAAKVRPDSGAAVGTFTLTGEMGNDRQYHASVKLADGRVMAVGGRGKGVSEWPIVHHSAEIYDPATGAWTRTGSTAEDRQFPAMGRPSRRERAAGPAATTTASIPTARPRYGTRRPGSGARQRTCSSTASRARRSCFPTGG